MDYFKLITRYKQFGGYRLVIEYARLGVLGTAVKGFFWCLVKRQSFKLIYPAVLRKIEPYLIERYSPIVQEFKNSRVQDQEFENSRINLTNTDSTNQTDRPIWFCWIQGLNDAPAIVKACYNSLEKHLVQELASPTIDATRQSSNEFGSALTAPIVQGVQRYEIKVIDAKNWKEFVDLPDYIVKK